MPASVQTAQRETDNGTSENINLKITRMKKHLLLGILALMMCSAAFKTNAQTWNISATSADHVTATLSSSSESGYTLTISGTGAMQNFVSYSSVPWSNESYGINSLMIGQGVTTIGNYAFWWCSNLTSVAIPNSVTSIGDWAFNSCSFTSVTIPNSVTSIGDYAFYNCMSMFYIKLPKSLTNLGNYIFSSCSNLQTIEVEWDTPLAITGNVFGGDEYGGYFNIGSCVLIVPTGTTALYKAANVWKGFKYIQDSIVPVTGIYLSQTSATFTGIGDGHLQLTATVAPANATFSSVVWTSSNTNVAFVNNTGYVYASSGGTAVITATTQDGAKSASCTVTVQYGDGTFTGISATLYNGLFYNDASYKKVSGFTDSIACLDFSKGGPFNINVALSANSSTVHPVKVSLYVPKKEFADDFPLTCAYDMGADQNYLISLNSNGTGNYHYPTLDDLVKVKEFAIDTSLVWGWYDSRYTSFQCYNISMNIPWDDMTDPALTDGISYPVHDNVWVVVTDAQTGEVLKYNSQDWSHPSRLSGTYLYKFTPQENSVLCDVYFTSQIPVKKAVSFFGDDCVLWSADRYELYKGDIGSMVLSLARGNNPNNWGDINYKAQDNIVAYQKFDNLSPDENGVYHISWEVKDLQGNFLDINKMNSINGYVNIGLYVEGYGQQTYNLGIPEYGGQYHGNGEYCPWNMSINYGVVPSPLNPNETVNYPEFEVDNGVLMHYHGTGGNVTIPNTVNSICDVAFYGHANIQSVTIQSVVTKIGDYTFSDCSGLKSVTIPSSVTSIGENAFYRCSSLASITCLNPDPNSIIMGGDYVFDGVNKSTCVLNVPVGSISLYQNADQWKDFAHINGITGIVNPEIQNLTLSPNPVKDELYITAERPVTKIEIYNADGKSVIQENNFTGKVNVSSLTKGVYVVKVYMTQGVAVTKMIKN